MQYWSMCIGVGQGTVPTVVNQLPGGHVDYGCRADEATTINAAGDYNYVIGSEAQRAAISKIPAPPSSPSRALKRRLRGVRGPSTSCCCATSSSAPASLIRRKRSLSRLTRQRPRQPWGPTTRGVDLSPRDTHDERAQRVRDPLGEDILASQYPGPSVPAEPARDAGPAVGSGPSSSERPALVVDHLSKRFGRRTAFDDVSFRVGTARSSASSAPTAPARPQRSGRSAPSSRRPRDQRRWPGSP